MSPVRQNREHWNRTSEAYQRCHHPQIGRAPRLWGMWSVPDADVHALPDLVAKDVLELGCGAGQWANGLADEGVTVVGLDLSDRQLDAARRLMRTPYPLVQAAGEQLPVRSASFDVVFSDHGAMSWGDPYRTIPEAARILRAAGWLVFCVTSPWVPVCYDDDADKVGTALRHDYFGAYEFPEDDGGGAATYSLGYGDWVRLFRRNQFAVENLIEIRAPEGAGSTYFPGDPPDWGRRWPAEHIWVARRA